MEGRYAMKFLLIVLAIRLLIELITRNKNKITKTEIRKVDKVYHPAEYEVREDEIRIQWW